MAFYHLLRLASRIRFLVSTVLQREIADPRIGMVTVLKVEVTPDIKEARVYITIFGAISDRSKTLHALDDARGFIQKEVGKNLETRSVPRLRFIIDDSQDKVSRIEALMAKAKEDQEHAMAKKPGKKDEKEAKGKGSKPSKPAPKPEKKKSEKGGSLRGGPAKGEPVKEPKETKPSKLDLEPKTAKKRPSENFKEEEMEKEDFDIDALGEEDKDFLEDLEGGEEDIDGEDDDLDDEEVEEEEEEEEKGGEEDF